MSYIFLHIRWRPTTLFTCVCSAAVRVHMCCDLPAAIISAMYMYSTFGSHYHLASKQNHFRDWDSNKEHEHTTRSWFQQIGWTCEEANMAIFMSDWDSCGKVTLWAAETFWCLMNDISSLSGGNSASPKWLFRYFVFWGLEFYNEFLCVFQVNKLQAVISVSNNRLMISSLVYLHSEWLSVFC